MTVSLTNTLGRLQVFVLPHETYCEALGKCACELRDARSGTRIPGSLTLPTGETIDELPDAILSVRDVRAAHHRGALVVKRVVPRPPEPASSQIPAPELNANSKKGKRGG